MTGPKKGGRSGSHEEAAPVRRNLNRGFKKLRVWQDAVALYVLACPMFKGQPFEFGKIAANTLDAVHSISRNIAEGYCRRGIREYLNFLNIALGSCGEFHSCYEAARQAGQLRPEDYEELDRLHFKLENGLLKLIESVQRKQKDDQWDDSFCES